MKTLTLFDNSSDFTTVEAGEAIFEQGQITAFMYVLIEGEAVVKLNGSDLGTVSAGSLLGVMGVLENRPHFATAIAKSPCKLVPIDLERFKFLVDQTPNFAIDVIEMMAEYLEKMCFKALATSN